MSDNNDMPLSREEELREDIRRLEWREHHVVNERGLIHIAAWRFDDSEISKLFTIESIAKIFASEYATRKSKRDHYLAQISPEGTQRRDINTAIEKALLASDLLDQDRVSEFIKILAGRLNQEVVRVTMAVMCRDHLKDPTRNAPSWYNINTLAEILDIPGSRAVYKQLSEWALPTLEGAGFIEGYWAERRYDRQEIQVSITDKGLKVHKQYLLRCSLESSPFHSELNAIDDELHENRRELEKIEQGRVL